MIACNIEFPYVHDLARLLSLLKEGEESIPATISRASLLTKYATITRYPGEIRPVSEAEYREAIVIAEAVVQWAEEQI